MKTKLVRSPVDVQGIGGHVNVKLGEIANEVAALEEVSGFTKSDIIRMALKLGLPIVKAGLETMNRMAKGEVERLKK